MVRDKIPCHISMTGEKYPLILLGREKHCESKLFCSRTRHIDPTRFVAQTSRPGVQRANYSATASPSNIRVTNSVFTCRLDILVIKRARGNFPFGMSTVWDICTLE